jgi:ribonuclease HIII
MGNSVMTAEQFVYWLQGYLELSDSKNLTDKQVEMIKQHLGYVFGPPVMLKASKINKGDLKSFC